MNVAKPILTIRLAKILAKIKITQMILHVVRKAHVRRIQEAPNVAMLNQKIPHVLIVIHARQIQEVPNVVVLIRGIPHATMEAKIAEKNLFVMMVAVATTNKSVIDVLLIVTQLKTVGRLTQMMILEDIQVHLEDFLSRNSIDSFNKRTVKE